MREILGLCGYEDHEMDIEIPRVKKVLSRLGITDDDIKNGKNRITKYYDLELRGIRKILGIFLRELVNITLAREEGKKKFIHGCMAPSFEVLGSALVSHSKEVCVMVPNPIFMVVLGSIFDKFVPVLEAAERLWLKGGLVSHCGMVKSRLGLLSLGLIERPDLMVTSGSLCETSPKTNDLIQEFYDIPTFCYDICRDRELREYPYSARTVGQMAKGIRKLVCEIEKIVDFKMTDEMLWEVLHARNRYQQAIERVRNLIRTSDPLPIKSTNDNLLTWLNALALSMDNIEFAITAVNTLFDELKDRVETGVGVVEKGAPRIMGILPHHHSDPRLEYLVNQVGMAMIATDMEFLSPIPEEEAPKDPYEAMSQCLYASLFNHLSGRVFIVLDACRELDIDGVLDHFHVGCRGVAGDALIFKEEITKHLGIPVLTLEWENFDPRVYVHEQYKTRLEAFKSMLRPG